MVQEDESEDVGGERECESDGDGVEMDGRRCRIDGATSGARRDLIQVEMRPLAGDKGGQDNRRNNMKVHVPEPSTPPPEHHRRPMDQPNPPRRRGRLKTSFRRPRNINNHRWTYQATRTHRGRIGRIERAGYVVYSQEMVQDRYRAAKREDESAGIDRGRACALGQQRDH